MVQEIYSAICCSVIHLPHYGSSSYCRPEEKVNCLTSPGRYWSRPSASSQFCFTDHFREAGFASPNQPFRICLCEDCHCSASPVQLNYGLLRLIGKQFSPKIATPIGTSVPMMISHVSIVQAQATSPGQLCFITRVCQWTSYGGLFHEV